MHAFPHTNIQALICTNAHTHTSTPLWPQPSKPGISDNADVMLAACRLSFAIQAVVSWHKSQLTSVAGFVMDRLQVGR